MLVRVVSTSGSPPGWGRPRRIGGPAARPLTGRGPHPRTIAPAQTDAPKVTTPTSGRTAPAPVSTRSVTAPGRPTFPAAAAAPGTAPSEVAGRCRSPGRGCGVARAGGPAAAPWIRRARRAASGLRTTTGSCRCGRGCTAGGGHDVDARQVPGLGRDRPGVSVPACGSGRGAGRENPGAWTPVRAGSAAAMC